MFFTDLIDALETFIDDDATASADRIEARRILRNFVSKCSLQPLDAAKLREFDINA